MTKFYIRSETLQVSGCMADTILARSLDDRNKIRFIQSFEYGCYDLLDFDSFEAIAIFLNETYPEKNHYICQDTETPKIYASFKDTPLDIFFEYDIESNESEEV